VCFDCGSHLKTSSQQKHVLSTKAPWREYKRNCDLNNYDDVALTLNKYYSGFLCINWILLMFVQFIVHYTDQIILYSSWRNTHTSDDRHNLGSWRQYLWQYSSQIILKQQKAAKKCSANTKRSKFWYFFAFLHRFNFYISNTGVKHISLK